MGFGNDDEMNMRELLSELGEEYEERTIIASLFYPFNRESFPTIALSIVARTEFDDFISRLHRHNVWLFKERPPLPNDVLLKLERWILEA